VIDCIEVLYGDRCLRSAALRGSLLRFEIPHTVAKVTSPRECAALGARYGQTPILRVHEGGEVRIVEDLFAILYFLDDRYPSLGIYPRDPADRSSVWETLELLDTEILPRIWNDAVVAEPPRGIVRRIFARMNPAGAQQSVDPQLQLDRFVELSNAGGLDHPLLEGCVSGVLEVICEAPQWRKRLEARGLLGRTVDRVTAAGVA
jgi:hypothetical protein